MKIVKEILPSQLVFHPRTVVQESTYSKHQYLLLQELLDNGQAELSDAGICVAFSEIVQLDPIDLNLLGLPSFFEGKIRLDAQGELGREGFRIQWKYVDYALSDYLQYTRQGAVLMDSERQPRAILTAAQYALCEALEQPVPTGASQWAYFAEIKALATSAGALLDAYLDRENVLLPETLELDLKLEAEALRVKPDISESAHDEELSSGFAQRFERFPRLRPTYSTKNASGETVRVAFSEPQQKALEKVKALGALSGEQKEKFIAHPEQFLDPEIINLDRFSQRVLEIGLYQPKFFPFVSPYKSEWIPGFLVENSAEDRQYIKFRNEAELDTFKAALDRADQKQEKTFQWGKQRIPVASGREIAQVAREQFDQPHQPVKRTQAGKKCLIIKDNLETMSHGSDEAPTSQDQLDHTYTAPPHLRKAFQVLAHQKEGIAWLQSLFEAGYSGALLADDMGVGKTLQGLSFLDWHHATNPGQPYLIVAPVSLLENWKAEFLKFFDSPLSVTLAYGSYLKEQLQGKTWEQQVNAFQNCGVVLTTYETLRSQQLVFCAVDWAIVLLDEAQKVKNPGTLATNAVKALKADFRIAATGTPVENTLVDLWCIMDFAAPGLLGSYKDFAQTYQKPLGKADTDVAALGEQLRQHIGIYIKRRLKTDIAQNLPQKLIQRIPHEMSATQKERYMQALGQHAQGEPSTNKQHMLQVIQNLREICAHPFLLESDIDQYDLDTLLQHSSKLSLCYRLLKDIQQAQEKVILFAERRETQRMLARLLQEGFGLTPSIINGSTPSSAQRANSAKLSRQQAINKFQAHSGFNGIVMSPIAAGVGLNVTGANHVIHYARHWNPAKEDQATDRAYRIGQDKDVHVYLPLATHPEFKSFDLILDELLERKRLLASASLFPTDQAEVGVKDLYAQLVN